MIVSKSFNFCRTAFASFVRRAFASSSASGGPPPPSLEGAAAEFPSASDETEEPLQAERKRYDYNSETLRELGYDKYPYYVERAWWKEGHRMTFWPHWRQLADIKRRRLVAEWGPMRMRYKAMKTNNILPRVIIDEFQERMDNMPRRAHPVLIIQMCQFTSKRRGKLNKFRVSRHCFRDIADRGGLSGIQRGIW
ncbi:hypothetical protein niasHS_002124 [Heterodera schachtii]|uniref:Ribosomal protein S14 n=1 Tax=Heterodera schachtii TaxID=97005 RepID=A0ABD2KMZ2_HETSC